MLLPYICAMLNSGGGYIIICEKNKQTQGYLLNREQKAKCQDHVRDCLSYIGPKVAETTEVTHT